MAHTDCLLKELKYRQSVYASDYRAKLRTSKALALAAAKFLAGRETRLLKQKEDEIRRSKQVARTLASTVRHFWKVIEVVVSQRCQSRLKEELRAEKETRQIALVNEAVQFAEAIAEGLKGWDDGLDPLMIQTKKTPIFSPPPWYTAATESERQTPKTALNSVEEKEHFVKQPDATDSEQEAEEELDDRADWALQEEEDAQLSAEMEEESTDGSSDIDSAEELGLLQEEAEMSLDQLREKFGLNMIGSSDADGELENDKTDETDDTDETREKMPPLDSPRSVKDASPCKHRSQTATRCCTNGEAVGQRNQTYMNTIPRLRQKGRRQTPKRLSEVKSATPSPTEPLEVSESEICANVTHRSKNGKTSVQQMPSTDHLIVKNPNASDSVVATDASDPPCRSVVESIPGKCPIPFLLRATLRAYQHEGLTWLLTLHDKKANGILADEMGLGKTIQTIALLAYLACYRGIWGPHLIVVPSSVVLNWETEFHRFFPGFKVLTYYGARKERERRRQGWSDAKAFNVCIVSYAMVVADAHIFRRKPWYYMVLDEAQNIKNYQSQKWQALLHFNTQRRVLLTGTPLQNDLTELWSLMHFLMPSLFQSHTYWKEMFSDPLTQAIEASSVEQERYLVSRLHSILRPFLLRRLKRDVESQMPSKYEHVVRCTLTKRQRALYNEFIERPSTKKAMSSSDYFGLLNILMQLRKVCNHPDLLAPREIRTPIAFVRAPSLVYPRFVRIKTTESWAFSFDESIAALDPFHPLVCLATSELMDLARPDYTECAPSRLPTILSESNFKLAEAIRVPLSVIDSSRTDCHSTHNRCDVRHKRQKMLCSETANFDTAHQLPLIQQLTGTPTPTSSCSPSALCRTPHRCSICQNTLAGLFHDASLAMPRTNFQTQHNRPNCQTPNHCRTSSTDARSETCFKKESSSYPQRSAAEETSMSFHDVAGENLVTALPAFSLPSNKRQRVSLNDFQPRVDMMFEHTSPSSLRSRNSTPLTLYQTLVQALDFPEDPTFPLLSVCPHTSFRGSADATCLVNSIPASQAPDLPRLRHPATALCSPLEQLSIQSELRSPNRRWLSQYALRLRKVTRLPTTSPPTAPTPQSETTKSCLADYRKSVTDAAKFLQIDHKPTHLRSNDDNALALQWMNCIAATVATLRRSSTIETILQHPKKMHKPITHVYPSPIEKEDKNVTNGIFHSKSNAPPHSRTTVYPPRRCLWGRRFRDHLRNAIWKPSLNLPYVSPHAPEFSVMTEPKSVQEFFSSTSALKNLCPSPIELLERSKPFLSRFLVLNPYPIQASESLIFFRGKNGPKYQIAYRNATESALSYLAEAASAFHFIELRQRCLFPPKMTLQYDCGKMIYLAGLLRKLKLEGHKCILFTQMSRMLDLLEAFLNVYGYTYVRLDGNTKIQQRQRVVEIFNSDPRVFVFMASTRAGGVGLNLIGADTVIFYDTDWNPAMDRQAMDRCHRIGQTRDVHVYRLITEFTIEENILRKQLLKRTLDDVVVDQGQFTTQRISEFITQADVKDMFITAKNSDNLYVTRTLHESSVALTPEDSKNDASQCLYQATITEIEQMEQRADQEIEQCTTADLFSAYPESNMDSSAEGPSQPKEPSDYANAQAMDLSTTAAVIATFGHGIGPTLQEVPESSCILSLQSKNQHDVPFWVMARSFEPKSCQENESVVDDPSIPNDPFASTSQAVLQLSEKTTVYVSQVVRAAVAFLEEHPSAHVSTDIMTLQQRLALYKSPSKKQ